jgi:hypothetical protein
MNARREHTPNSGSVGPMASPQVKTRRSTGWLRNALAAVLTLGVMLLVVIVLAQNGIDLFKVQSVTSQLRPWGAAIQMLIVAFIGLRWHVLVRFGQRRNIVLDHEFERVIALRPKVMAWLCAYLLLIPIGPLALWRALGLG